MKLYAVEVTFKTVVRAPDALAAELLAEDVVKDEDDPADSAIAYEIKTLDDLPSGWKGNCIPWGERDPMDRTIKEILDENTH